MIQWSEEVLDQKIERDEKGPKAHAVKTESVDSLATLVKTEELLSLSGSVAMVKCEH